MVVWVYCFFDGNFLISVYIIVSLVKWSESVVNRGCFCLGVVRFRGVGLISYV